MNAVTFTLLTIQAVGAEPVLKFLRDKKTHDQLHNH